jgi:hypothetical protein
MILIVLSVAVIVESIADIVPHHRLQSLTRINQVAPQTLNFTGGGTHTCSACAHANDKSLINSTIAVLIDSVAIFVVPRGRTWLALISLAPITAGANTAPLT